MRNIAPSRALVRRSRQFLQLALFLFGLGAFAGIAGITLRVIRLVPPSSSAFGTYLTVADLLIFVGVCLGIAGFAVGVRAATWRPDNDLAKVVGQYLENYLDNGYTLIRNVNKFRVGYIDAVLVGPPGVLVFRIIDRRGTFLNEGDRWLKAGRDGEWVPAGFNATVEAAVDVKALRKYLAARGLGELPVFGVVVFMRNPPEVKIEHKDPLLPSTTLGGLMKTLERSYLAKVRIQPQQIKAVVDLLYRD